MTFKTIENAYPTGITAKGTLMLIAPSGDLNIEFNEEALARLQYLISLHTLYKFPSKNYRYELSPQGCSILPSPSEQDLKA